METVQKIRKSYFFDLEGYYEPIILNFRSTKLHTFDPENRKLFGGHCYFGTHFFCNSRAPNVVEIRLISSWKSWMLNQFLQKRGIEIFIFPAQLKGLFTTYYLPLIAYGLLLKIDELIKPSIIHSWWFMVPIFEAKSRRLGVSKPGLRMKMHCTKRAISHRKHCLMMSGSTICCRFRYFSEALGTVDLIVYALETDLNIDAFSG